MFVLSGRLPLLHHTVKPLGVAPAKPGAYLCFGYTRTPDPYSIKGIVLQVVDTVRASLCYSTASMRLANKSGEDSD
jgi:hypothetical protein